MPTREILIVDDDDDVREMLASYLELKGCSVAAVSAVEPAFKHLRGEAVCDLLLIDGTLPGMEGFEALQQIAELRPGLPVVLASGLPAAEYEAIAFRYGASAYLQKPFDLKRLDALIEDLAVEKRSS